MIQREDEEHVHTRMKPGVQVVVYIFRGKVEPRGENVLLVWNLDLTIGVTASKHLLLLVSSLSHGLPNLCFFLPFIFSSKSVVECISGPLRLPFDSVSVKFWWSLARTRFLIFYPKRELPSLVPLVVVLYSFFPAVVSNKQRTLQCNNSLSHLTCQSPPAPLIQLILFCPIKAINFPTFPAMVRATFDLVTFIICKENSSSSACGVVNTPPFTESYLALPKEF